MSRFWNHIYSASVKQWAVIMSALPVTAVSIWLIYIIRYGWPQTQIVMLKQLDALMWTSFFYVFLLGLIIVRITGTNFKATGFGGSLQMDNDEDEAPVPPPGVTVTQTATQTKEVKNDT